MGLQLPDWVRTMFLVVTGDGWPEADEDELWALARTWMELGDTLTDLEEHITDPVRAVRRTDWDGPAAQAFAAARDALGGEGGRPLAGLAQGGRQMAEFVYETGVNVQYMKFIVLGELLILAAQITYLIALSPWIAGASTAAVPALQSAGRSFALTAMRRLATSIAASMAAQIGLDAAAQLVQRALGTRKRWDRHLTESAAITGAVGWALAPVAGGLSRSAVQGLRPLLGGTVATGLGHVVGNAVHEYATSAVTGLATGHGWTGTPWDLTAGATQGVLDAAGGRRRGARPPDPAILDIGHDATAHDPQAVRSSFRMPPDAPVDMPPYVADGMLGMVDAELTPTTGATVVDFVNQTLSRPEALGQAPKPDDPGMQRLRQTLAVRFEEFLGEGRTFTVRDGNQAVEVTVQAGLTGELSTLRQRDDGVRHMEKYWKTERYHTDTNTYTRSRMAQVSTSDTMPAPVTAATATLQVVRSQPTTSSTSTATVLAQHRTRGRTGEWSTTADTRWTVRVHGPPKRTGTAAHRLATQHLATPHPATQLLASTSMDAPASASLSIPEYIGRPLQNPPVTAPAVIDLSRVAAPPRAFSVEGLSGTAAVFAAVTSAVPDATRIGSAARAALRELTGRGHLTNVLDQMLGTWLYSKPLFHDATGRPLGAVRLRASLGQARLLSQANDGELAMWHTAGLSIENETTLSRTDGAGLSAKVGGIVTAGHGGVPASPHASAQAAVTATASYTTTAGSAIGGVGLSQQGASIGAATALYEVDVTFEIQALGSARIHRVDATALMRTLTEEALRLDHAAREDPTPFAYPSASSARPRTDTPGSNNDLVQPPEYLASAHPLTPGSSMVGEVTGVAHLHDHLVEALHRELPDLFPIWEQANPTVYADDPALFATAVQNYTALAERFSAAALRGGVSSLLGDGLRLRLRRGGLLHNDYYTLVLNARLSDRSHRGSTTTVRAVDIAGQIEHLLNAVHRGTSLRVALGLTASHGGFVVPVGPTAGVSWMRGFLGRYGATSTFYTLSFFPKGVEVFDYTVEYQARLEHFRRPRGWRRTILTWPLTAGWRLHAYPHVPLLDPVRPVNATMTLWTPQERSWTRVEEPTAPPPEQAPQQEQAQVSTTSIAPETAKQVLAQPRPAHLSRTYHLEALNHAPDLLLTHVRRLLAEVSGGETMMTADGTPAMNTLAERLSPEVLKGHITAMTGPDGMRVTGPIGDGPYRDWHWSAQLRATPRNWRTVDVVDSATIEEYYAGGSTSAITRLRATAFDASIGVGGGVGADSASGTAAMSATYAKATQHRTTVAITGDHERNRSGAGPYVILKADLDYTLLAQARWRSLPADVLPRAVRPAVREAAAQISVPDGVYIMMHEADAREAGLLAGVPTPPPPTAPAWQAPDYLARALGNCVLEEKVDANWIVDELRTRLPEKLRNLLPKQLADDIMGGLNHLTAATTASGIGGLIDNLYDGGVAIPLRRRGVIGAKAVTAVLRLEPAGAPRFLDLRGDANVESYRQGTVTRDTGTTTTRSRDVTLSAGGGPGRQPHPTLHGTTPSVALSSGTSDAVETINGHVVRIDNIIAATGPTARFAVPVRLVVAVKGGGLTVAPISTEPRTVLLRIPETLATPQDAAQTPETVPAARVQMLDRDQTSAEQIVAWKNDPSFTRLPTHHGVELVSGTAAVRDAAEQAISAVTGHGTPGIEFGSQLWSAISNTMLASTMFAINNATDPDPASGTPRLRVDQIDDIGLPLPVPLAFDPRGGRRIDVRLMANLAAPKLVGATSEQGELVRLEQRRILTLTEEFSHTATERHRVEGPGPKLTDSSHPGSTFGVATGPVAVAGKEAETRTSGGTGDSYQVHRHATRTYLFTADVIYRVVARHAGRSAAAEALVPAGLNFRLTEADALALGLITAETVAKYRPALDAVGVSAADWRSTAAEVDRAASAVGQEHRALLRRQEREHRHWTELAPRCGDLARFAENLTGPAPADAQPATVSELSDHVMGCLDALASTRATLVSRVEALTCAADEGVTWLDDASDIAGTAASAAHITEAIRTLTTSSTTPDARLGQRILAERVAELSADLQAWSEEISHLVTGMDRLAAARADYRAKQFSLDQSTTVLADRRRQLHQMLHTPSPEMLHTPSPKMLHTPSTDRDEPNTTGRPSLADLLRDEPNTTGRPSLADLLRDEPNTTGRPSLADLLRGEPSTTSRTDRPEAGRGGRAPESVGDAAGG